MSGTGAGERGRPVEMTAEERLRLIVERMADGVVVVGEDGIIRFANPAAERLFGRSADELVGETFGHPMIVDEATEIDLLQKGGGSVVVELRAVEMPWQGETACVVSLRDVTDRKQAEERERELATEQAARAEAEAAEQRYRRLAEEKAALAEENQRLYLRAQEANRAKSEFLAVMSHELRTPLNAIIGYTDLLMEEISGPLQDTQRQQLDRVNACSHHLLELVDDILSYSRMEAGKEEVHLAPVDYRRIVDQVVDVIRPAAERKQLRLEVDLAEGFGPGTSDPPKVRQILVNLVSNAIKFTEKGEVRVEGRQADGRVEFRVRDTGIGIPEDRLSQIWDPFWQVQQSRTRTRGGTGLGLSVVRRLSELLGGEAHAESTVGGGSTFIVRLPSAVEEPRSGPDEHFA